MLFLKLLLSSSLIFGGTAKDNLLDPEHYRLPDYIKPIHYELEIKLSRKEEEKKFVGKLSARIKIDRPTRSISLHNDEMFIFYDTIFLEAENTSKNKKTIYAPNNFDRFTSDNSIFIIIFNEELANGTYVLSMSYLGNLLDDGEGFVSTFYYEKSNPEVKKT